MRKEIKWKYNIGQIIKDEKRDITITDRKIIKNKNGWRIKYYKYRCNKCHFDCGKYYHISSKEYKDEYFILEDNLNQGKGCPCCCVSPNIIVKGINDIATAKPEWISLFVNKEDLYTHTISSKDKVLIKCKNCGYIKFMCIDTFNCFDFSCDMCGDGVKYPEKVMFNLLNNIMDDFIYQYTKVNNVWCDKYKYDFHFILDNEHYIVETHGKQHYEDSWSKLETTQLNDKIKKELALANEIKEENYIVINCRYSKLDWIKEHVLNSRLSELFDLSKIDWNKCNEFATKSLCKEVCDYWKLHNDINNENLNVNYLSKVFKLSDFCICNYLKQGSNLDIPWCNYNPQKEFVKGRQKGLEKCREISCKKVEIFKNKKSLGVFESATELIKQSEKLFGVKLTNSKISLVCNGKKPQYKGFTFKYIQETEDVPSEE